MPYPAAVAAHRRRLDRTTLALLLAIRQLWRRLEPAATWEDQYADTIGPQILALTLAAQTSVTATVDTHMADLLNLLGFGPQTQPGVVPTNAFVGLAGDGRPVETLQASAIGRARASANARRQDIRPTGAAAAEVEGAVTITRPATEDMQRAALADGEAFMALVTSSILADTARAAEAAALAPRPWVDGFVRVINPPCCSRCAVLAGKFFLWNEGFLRHPRCDCSHLPAPARGPALDQLLAAESPDRYFDSLSRAEQDRVFTQAGARAIREGADIGQVVNARSGMTTAGESNTRAGLTASGEETRVNVSVARAVLSDLNGRQVLVTTTGTTRRGVAYTALSRGSDRDTDTRRVVNGRRQRVASTRAPRLMPESLAAVAGDDRDEFVRLLRLNGFIT